MDRTDIAYLVNSTIKYFYMLPLHFLLVRRYAEELHWPLFLATEHPDHSIVKVCNTRYNVKILPLDAADQHFIECRLAATRALPPEIRYVLPMQEDFLLQYRVDRPALERALKILDDDPTVASIRLMPCPGPCKTSLPYNTDYAVANGEIMYFTFQATLFRREVYETFMAKLVEESSAATSVEEKLRIQLKTNIAENRQGQKIFQTLALNAQQKNLIWRRVHTAPNAVYLSPWPYRPTAVEKGVLQNWAKDFSEREGFPLLINDC